MYKLLVQLLDLNNGGNPVIHEVHSPEFASIQEAMESYNGKEDFQVYLEIEQDIMKSINAISKEQKQ